ncbi:MAG: hypothetical protein QXO69_01710 [archaeon]
MNDRAQISAEMMMILAILVGLAIMLMSMLSNNASSFATKFNASSEKLMNDIDKIINSS